MARKYDAEALKLTSNCIVMRLTEKEALRYLEVNLGRPVPPRTYGRWKRHMEQNKLEQLYEIGQYGFVEQHVDRIQQLELIDRLMWECQNACPDPFKKAIILERIAKIQPYLSAYYEATKDVVKENVIRPKALSVSKQRETP
jgi:hypothetical protein